MFSFLAKFWLPHSLKASSSFERCVIGLQRFNKCLLIFIFERCVIVNGIFIFGHQSFLHGLPSFYLAFQASPPELLFWPSELHLLVTPNAHLILI